jgi:hypothetical protein
MGTWEGLVNDKKTLDKRISILKFISMAFVLYKTFVNHSTLHQPCFQINYEIIDSPRQTAHSAQLKISTVGSFTLGNSRLHSGRHHQNKF